MKRLLALLLALALLGSFAAAEESVRWTVTCSADVSGAADALKLLGAEDAKASAAAGLLETFAGAAAGMRLILQTQESGIRCAFVWEEDELLSFTAAKEADGGYLVASSLWPEYILRVRGTEAAAETAELQRELKSAADGWAAYRMSPAEETGIFAGETYAGGDRKATVVLTDRDLADFAESMILVYEEHNEQFFGKDGSEAAAALWHGLRAVNQQIRNENRFSYTFHRVWKDDRLIGMSLTIRDREETEWVLSAGLEEENTVRFAATVHSAFTGLLRGTLTQGGDGYELTAREYLAAPGTAFAEAEAGPAVAVTVLKAVRETAEPFVMEDGTVVAAEDAAENEGFLAAAGLGGTALVLGLMRHLPEGLLQQLLQVPAAE